MIVEQVFELSIILVLVLVNGLFAGAEIAVVTSRRAAILEQAERGSASAKALVRLMDSPERFLATVQVGITVVGAGAAAFGGASLTDHLAGWLMHFPVLAPHAEVLAFTTIVMGISFFSIVVGELVPKSLALRHSEPYALAIARPMQVLSLLASPLVWVLSSAANLVLRPFGDSTSFTEARHSARDLLRMVDEATRAGTVDKGAGEIASRALEMSSLTAADVLVPRQEVIMLSLSASPAEIERILLEDSHSRFPVYDGRQDNIVGYISVKDVFGLAWERQLIVLSDLLRPPLIVIERLSILELFHQMRKSRTPLAVVVDEYGGFSGICTLEDLFEELVGELWSEHSIERSGSIEGTLDDGALVQGAATVRDINRGLDIDLPEEGEYTTMAGLVIALAGRIPTTGTQVETGGFTLTVLEATPRRVLKVLISRAAQKIDEPES